MRAVWIALCLIGLGGPAVADPIPVRTGEHSSFTRVVLEIAPNMDWALGRTPDGYVLRLETDDGFDLSTFFDIIPRARIRSVSQDIGAGELTMDVTCACNARAYVFRDSFLVIDVADGLPTRISRFELALPDVDADVASTPQPGTTHFALSRAPLLPIVIDRADVGVNTVGEDMPNDVAVVEEPVLSEVTNELESQVAHILGSALSQGLVTPNEGSERGGIDNALAEIQLRINEIPGVETRTSIDPLSGQVADNTVQTQTGVACLPARFFDVPNWSDDSAFSDQLSKQRPLLFGEFDRPDEDAILKMARTFIYFGFGKEAQQTLALDQRQSQERQYLAALGRIIDGQTVNSELFKGQESCASNVALWAFLAATDQPLEGRVARDAALQNFKALPVHLQDNLGPRLSRMFTRVGDLDAAEQVGKRFDTNATNASEAAIAQSVLAESGPDITEVLVPLEAIVAENARATPALMARYFEEGIASGKSFDRADFVLADALSFENAQSDAVTQLRVAQFRALLSIGDFPAAKDILEQDLAVLTPQELPARVVEYSQAAVETMGDAEFGRFVWARTHVTDDPMIRDEIATRVAELGFDEMAARLRGESAVPSPVIAPMQGFQISGGENAPSFTAPEPLEPAVSLANARALLAESEDFRTMLESQLNARASEEIARN